MNESLDRHYYLRFPHTPPAPRSNSEVTNGASLRPLLTFMKPPRAAAASRSGENYELARKLAQSPVVHVADPNFVIFIFSRKPVRYIVYVNLPVALCASFPVWGRLIYGIDAAGCSLRYGNAIID